MKKMSFLHEMEPVLKVSRVFGCVPFKITSSTLVPSRVAIFYCSLWIFIHSLCCWFTTSRNRFGKNKENILTFGRQVLICASLVVSVLTSIIWREKLVALMSQMQKCDLGLKMQTKGNSQFRSWTLLGSVVLEHFIKTAIILLIVYTVPELDDTSMEVFIYNFIHTISYCALSYSVMSFAAFLIFIRKRFRHINQLFQTALHETSLVISLTEEKNKQLQLRDAWWIHASLMDLAEDVNYYFGLQLTLWLITFAFVITTVGYEVLKYGVLANLWVTLYYVFLIAINASHLVVIAIICHMTSTEANKTGRIMYSPKGVLRRQIIDGSSEENIDIALYFLHRRLRFTAAGFVDVDLPVLLTIVGAMTTYLVIILRED